MGNSRFFSTCSAASLAILLAQTSMPVQAGDTDNNNEVKAPPPLIQFASVGVETLAEAGLKNPSTLWVPASYTGSHDALYINGKRYAAPGGFSDVPGFIKTPGGYTVAVRQDRIQMSQPPVGGSTAPAGGLSAQQTQTLQQQVQQIQQMPGLTPAQRTQMLTMLMQATLSAGQAAAAPQMPAAQFAGGIQPSPGLVFYSVSSAGQTLATIGSLPASKTARVLVTQEAIYVEQEDGKTAYDRLPLFSYVGIDGTGKQISGPQDVLFASPAPDSGWYVKQLVKAQDPSDLYATYSFVFSHVGSDGNRTEIFRDDDQYTAADILVHGTVAVADMPPLVDSVRTGEVVRLAHNGTQSIGNDFTDWMAAAYDLGKAPPTSCRPTLFGKYCTRLWGSYSLTLGAVRSMDIYSAYAIAQGITLFGTPDKPQLATQLSNDAGLGKALQYGIVDTASQERTALFQIMGSGSNAFRSFVGTNTGAADASSFNNAYNILTPRGLILAQAGSVNRNQDKPGFDLSSQKTISASDINGFLMQYGMAH